MSSAKKQKPKRTIGDYFVNIICVLILVLLVYVEYSHLRKPNMMAQYTPLYEKHYYWFPSPPFVISYYLMPPENFDPAKKYPLLLVLHGITEYVYGAVYIAKPDFRARYPAFVVVPIISARSSWATPVQKEHRLASQGPRYPDALPQAIGVVEMLLSRYPIDAGRIYLTGHNMGAYGTYAALEKYPGFFAGATALAGLWNPMAAPAIAKTPIWAFHGSKDNFVTPDVARELMYGVTMLDKRSKWTEMPKGNHGIWKDVYNSTAVWDWLFEKRLTPQ